MPDLEKNEEKTICEDCGRTIPKPRELKGFQIVPLCKECYQKKLANY